VKGHILTTEDLIIRQHILNLMCHFQTSWQNTGMQFEGIELIVSQLNEMQEDGLIELLEMGIKVTEKGKPFVRNLCMAFDLRLKRKAPETSLFSMTV
jgi:oxygen-independent coproporphyrinogen-3 oxidase